MALSGVHVACGYDGGIGAGLRAYAIFSRFAWSETMGSAGTTALGATALNDSYGEAILRVHASADVYVAIAQAPNASAGPRVFVKAGETTDFYAQPGEKLAWIAA